MTIAEAAEKYGRYGLCFRITRAKSGIGYDVELVNMPADLAESLKASRVSFEQIAASGYATRIYEAVSRENPEGIDVPSFFVAAVGVKGTIDPPATWDSAERLTQKCNENLSTVWWSGGPARI